MIDSTFAKMMYFIRYKLTGLAGIHFLLAIIPLLITGCGAVNNLELAKEELKEGLGVYHPHIILVTIDTLRADHLGCYQYQDITTPCIDSLAKEGVLFEYAYTPTPITLPSHVSIMTGLYPQAHGVYNNATYYLNPAAITLAEVLQGAGYQTAAFIGAYVLHSRYGLNQGFQLYNDYLPYTPQSVKSFHNLYDERRAEETTALALEWLSDNRKGPCFLWIHYFEPHAPYIPPPRFIQEYKNRRYDGEIAYVDQCLDNLIKGIKAMDIYDNTAFIITSDHGEGLGEHKEMTHGVFLYDSTLQIPLIMRLPGLKPSRIPQMCRNIDIFPTILEYCAIPYPEDIQGMSLLPLMLGEKKSLDLELLIESRYASENFGWADLLGIRTREWKYIKAPVPELYNLINDPQENRNIWNDQPERGREIAQKFEAQYTQALKQKQFDTRTAPLTPQLREQMMSLGYVWAPSAKDDKIDPKQMAPLLDKLDKGVIYYTMGMYNEAIEEMEKLIELNPRNPMAHFHLGCAYFLQGNLSVANDHFIKVTQLDKRHIDAYNYQGYIYAELNDLKRAEDAFKQALKLNPGFADGHYNLGILYYRQGDLQRSLNEFLVSTQLNPRHLEGVFNLGSLYLDMGYFREAEECLKQALGLDPNHPQSRNSLGKLYNKTQEYEKAEEQFLRAIRADASYKEAHNNLASVYIQQKRYDEALKHLEEALAYDQNFADALYNLGVVFRALGDLAKALEYFERSESKGLFNFELCFAKGDTYLRLEHYEQARQWLQRAIAINPDSWKAHFELAVALSAGNYNVNEAIKEYERVIALHPEATETYINLGILHFQQGNQSLAVKLWQQALFIDPKNIESQINLGAAYIQLGLYKSAVEIYKKILRLQPDNLNLYYNLAIAYLHQKNNKEAILTLNRALRIDPGFEAGKKLLDLANNNMEGEKIVP